MSLKDKKVLLAGWGCENPRDTYMYQIYYLILKKIFPKIDTFDSKKNYFQLGKNEMNKSFLEIIKEKNYDLILFAMEYDEFSPGTLEKMKKLSPKTKFVIIICDDDARFDDWSRYIALFFDYVITSQNYVKEYKKEGIDVFFHFDYNTYKLKPMNIKKIYDVTFIGRPKADRNEVIKYLLDNGINIMLFGWDWYKYPEFEKVYGGPLSQEDYARVINQSKINLSPAKAGYSEEKEHYNMKGRYYEVSLCKSFQLVERFPVLLKFFNEKEMGMYDSQEDMLDKIRYYLKHEKEREQMAKRAYEKTLRKYNREKQLIDIFTRILKSKEKTRLLSVNKKIITLEKKDLYSDLNEKLKNIDYVSFKTNNLKNQSNFKDYFLERALNVTGKDMACCDYYVSPLGLKDYMTFASNVAFKRIGKEANRLIDLNQLMVKKNFFLEHLGEFQKLSNNKPFNLINKENTALVSIPLVSIKKIRKIEYEKMKKAFEFRFQNDLFSLYYNEKLWLNPYPYALLLKSIFGNFFILKYLFELKKDKAIADKLSVNRAYIEGSPLEKFCKKN